MTTTLEQLCRTYWYPLYAYLRRCGHSHSDAQDLVQGYFLQLLEHRSYCRADPNRGRAIPDQTLAMKHPADLIWPPFAVLAGLSVASAQPILSVSRRTDIYALGATLYHLLTGRPPFQAESLAQTLDLVLHQEPVSPRLLQPGVPRDLETICLKCLEKDSTRRYRTAKELADELRRFLSGESIRARPVGVAGKGWRWCRRNPLSAGLAGIAGLFLLHARRVTRRRRPNWTGSS